jgi:hypothetical protein
MLKRYVMLVSLFAFTPVLVANADNTADAVNHAAAAQAHAMDHTQGAIKESETAMANAKTQIDNALKNVEDAKAAANVKKNAADATAKGKQALKDAEAPIKAVGAH